MTLKKLTPGTRTKTIPGATWNSMVDYIQPRVGGFRKTNRPIGGSGRGGGGESGSGTTPLVRYLLVEDIPGIQWDETTDGYESATVKCALIKKVGGRREIDFQSPLVPVEILNTAAISLQDTVCGGSATTSGLVIDVPISGNNRVDPGEDTTVTVSGSGADPLSSVWVRAHQGASYVPSSSGVELSVNSDGTWSTVLDITSLANGVVLIGAQEEDASGFFEKLRIVPITYTKGLSTAQVAAIPATPSGPPNLTYDSDLGISNIDDRTAETQPEFDGPATHPNDIPRIYADGVLIGTGDVFSTDETPTGSGNYVWTLASTTVLAEGNYDITVTLETVDGWTSGHSPPLRVAIDPTEIGGEIQAVVHATLPFTVATDPIQLDPGAIVTGPPGATLPPPPTQVANPPPGIAGSGGTELTVVYIDSVWSIAQAVPVYYRLGWGRKDDDGTYVLENLDSCRIRASAKLVAYANGTTFATAHGYASAAYATSTDPIPLKSFTVFPPDGTTPPPNPTSGFKQPTTPISGSENDSIIALFDLVDWVVVTNNAGYPTGTALATAAYTTGDASISVDGANITVPEGVSDPGDPTSVLQPSVPISGGNNDMLSVIYDGSDWRVQEPS